MSGLLGHIPPVQGAGDSGVTLVVSGYGCCTVQQRETCVSRSSRTITSVDGCSVLDWTNIAENAIGGLMTAAVVGVFILAKNRVTNRSKKKRRRPSKKHRR